MLGAGALGAGVTGTLAGFEIGAVPLAADGTTVPAPGDSRLAEIVFGVKAVALEWDLETDDDFPALGGLVLAGAARFEDLAGFTFLAVAPDFDFFASLIVIPIFLRVARP